MNTLDYRKLVGSGTKRISAADVYPFTKTLVAISDSEKAYLDAAQLALNKLYARVALTPTFLSEQLGGYVERYGFISNEVKIYLESDCAHGKPRACFGNNVYLNEGAHWTCTCANYLSAEAALQAHFHDEMDASEHKADSHTLVELHSGAFRHLPVNSLAHRLRAPIDDYIIQLAKLVHEASSTKPVLHYLTKTFLGTKALEIYEFCRRFESVTGIVVKVVTWEDLAHARPENGTDQQGRYRLFSKQGDEISVVFCRTELFGHPTGTFLPSQDSAWEQPIKDYIRYAPLYAEFQKNSAIIFVPTLGERLARSRMMEQSIFDRAGEFLTCEETTIVREILPRPRDLPTKSSLDRNSLESWLSKNDLVAKNVLRGYYRPVQSNLEARAGKGRNDAEIIVGTPQSTAASENHLILSEIFQAYPKVYPTKHDAEFVTRDGQKLTSLQFGNQICRTEVALFSIVVIDSHGDILENTVAGYGARTKPEVYIDQISDASAYGAIASLTLALD
jgi:hypothetical protein